MHHLALRLASGRRTLLAEGSADGRLWWVHRDGDQVVAVVESATGRSEFRGAAGAQLRGPVGLGRCGSDLAGRWWSLVIAAAVDQLWLDDGSGLVEQELPRAYQGRRHLLVPAAGALWWQAATDRGTVTGLARF